METLDLYDEQSIVERLSKLDRRAKKAFGASGLRGRDNVYVYLGRLLMGQFEVRSVGYQRIPADARVVLSTQHLVGSDFRGRHLMQFSSDGCRFERCDFKGAKIQSASFGAGRRVSEYIGCSFDGATLRMGPGGYARFVDCSFEKTAIDAWFCFAVELVGCRFSGRLKKAVFNGTVPAEKEVVVGRAVNQFEGNDFSRASLIDVGFRTGIDLSRQRLPEGAGYTYFPDAVVAVRNARLAFNAWDDPGMKVAARGVLTVMEKDVAAGQRQLLMRADNYPSRDRAAIRKLLDAAEGR